MKFKENIGMKILMRERDLSDDYILFAQQIGADGFDIHNPANIPGFVEQGYPDLAGLVKLKEKLLAAGLGIYRVAPPDPRKFLLGEEGGEQEIDNLCKTIEIFGQAGIPFMSMPVHLGINPGYRGGCAKVHRGGYTMHGFEMELMKKRLSENPPEPFSVEKHWERCVQMYQWLVPVAEKYSVKLITHPSDPPLPETEFSPRRWAGILDAVPSDHSGLLYCIGTRCESGVNIFDDIRYFGRKGKIFHTHFRNVRGTIPTSGGYEEVALDDGDMNMFKVLQTLKEVGFDGGLQIDHLPNYTGDTADQKVASGYAVGYVRALLVALNA
jgi:mannonate dehydratase